MRGTAGWQLTPDIEAERKEMPVDKPTFGSAALGQLLKAQDEDLRAKGDRIEKITLVGLCTDICVISNALLLKAFLPECEIAVDAACCAGVTPGMCCSAVIRYSRILSDVQILKTAAHRRSSVL